MPELPGDSSKSSETAMPRTHSQDTIELRGGRVYDSVQQKFVSKSVYFSNGVIIQSPDHPAPTIIDVHGALVSAGLVDLHSHIFMGQDSGVDPDMIGPRCGVTSMVDAGSAGAHLIGAFRRSTTEKVGVRTFAFLNISSIGITSMRLRGELKTSEYLDEPAAIAAAKENEDIVVGIKVRASHDVAGDAAKAALLSARRVSDITGLPLMVHLGPAPADVDEILGCLKSGDIITHCFTGFLGNTLLEHGRVRRSVVEARRRGVLFDVGHGSSGFDSEVARVCLQEGFVPDTISTDVHRYSYESKHVTGMTTVMSQMLSLGLSLEQTFHASTAAPGSILPVLDGSGSLRPGARADISVFDHALEQSESRDGHGHVYAASERLDALMTFQQGKLTFERLQKEI